MSDRTNAIRTMNTNHFKRRDLIRKIAEQRAKMREKIEQAEEVDNDPRLTIDPGAREDRSYAPMFEGSGMRVPVRYD